MSYNYQLQRPWLFTEEGQVALLKVRDHTLRILKTSGAIMMHRCIPRGSGCGDSWNELAVVDRLVELGDLREIDYGPCAGQHRIFVDGRPDRGD